MSLYSAMRSGVSGMSAQSSRLAAISDNISNSQTVGYKRATVDFSTLVTSPGSRSTYTASGVQSATHYQVQQDGTILGTGSSTDMAISGNGFFVVGNKASGTPQYSLTRAGSFLPDEAGFLHNNAGQYLEAWKLNPDGTMPNVSTSRFDDLQSVNIGNLVYGGSKTTQMDFSGNLPAQAVAGDSFTSSPTFYDGLGNPLDLSLTWTKTATPNQWTLTATGPTGYTVTGAPATLTFAATGPYAGKPVDGAGLPLDPMPSLTVNSPATPTADSFTMSLGNVTQLNGDYVPTVTGDGAKVGQVTSVNIDDSGKLWVMYDNGARQALYQIPIATVTNPDGLVAQDGNTYTLGADTGTLTLGAGKQGSAGSVVGSALEQSNVDIATELVSLIETQRAYSSSATLVRTADEMVEETTRLKR
ncbi:flagellar hook protein FlgE [Azospirillum lipoferum]|uniref:Flagellar hook protein FlgE n=1 Tax=Azospirillum lipoferum TaxID=193 RepID=A0A5A9GBK1_AZOLI|nr:MULTISPECIES: flagellar hook protein FlgE [Azospirillum]KAA0591850.1 flagellar hook protein FlgE [Azospirillum lipoferum]MCP1614641.1 flagellar hook protein FlgE [Azospirillum lipoferum]MDW5537523.1 flagellar hook protein FlgE [Azospirillum sp. NL1]